ncbi:MAG TPA: CARDB domain-containing protein, partial [Gammaproteobacteria bacterium]|nr:CARDB domain-containing protein [Gammaproteobacteria bacterium]
YLFDRKGKIVRSMSVMKERTSSSQEFKSLWATRTTDGRTVFAASSDIAIWAGVYTDSGEALSWEVEPKIPNYPDYFAANYDASLDRLYILHSNFYDPGYTRMTRWTLNGTLDKDVDLSSEFGAVYRSDAYQLLQTPEGLLVSLPGRVSTDPYRFFILNADCTIKREVEVTGLSVQVCDDGDGYSWHAVTLDDRNVVRIVWPANSPRRFYYAAYNLSGRLLVPAMAVSQEGKYTALHPSVFVDGRRTTFFYSISDSLYQRLFCRHTAFDFASGQPDLVVSVPHITQSPDYATLGAGVAFRVRVFNRGEAASTAATVTLAHNGVNYVASVEALEPGQSQLVETEFLDIPTPPYLTAMPTVTVDLTNGYWTGNNHVETLVCYPGRTPIYPAGSEEYTWTVRIKDTTTPLQYAQVITTLPNIQTADGVVKDGDPL